jgi:O-succinylbenzoic acid--CoA ligase
MVMRHAREAGGEAALIEGDRVLTWRDLCARAEAIAGGLTARGVAPGDRVALVAPASIDGIAALLGILRAGAVAAPIAAGLTAREMAAAVETLEPRLVLAEEDLAGAGGAPDGRPVSDAVERDPEAPAVVVLTTGTTGLPKAVVLSSRALAASAESWLAALPPATGWLLTLGPAHVAGLGIVWRAIAGRVPVRIVPAGDAAALLAALGADPPASHISIVPAQLARLLDAAADVAPPPSLRAVLLGGGPIPPALVTRATAGGWPVVPTCSCPRRHPA